MKAILRGGKWGKWAGRDWDRGWRTPRPHLPGKQSCDASAKVNIYVASGNWCSTTREYRFGDDFAPRAFILKCLPFLSARAGSKGAIMAENCFCYPVINYIKDPAQTFELIILSSEIVAIRNFVAFFPASKLKLLKWNEHSNKIFMTTFYNSLLKMSSVSTSPTGEMIIKAPANDRASPCWKIFNWYYSICI